MGIFSQRAGVFLHRKCESLENRVRLLFTFAFAPSWLPDLANCRRFPAGPWHAGAMESPVSVPEAKDIHPLERMALSFTANLATALSGTSVIESVNGTSNPRIGLQLIAGNQHENAPTTSHGSTARHANGPDEPTTRFLGLTRPAPTANRANPPELRQNRGRNARRYPLQSDYEDVFVRPCRKPSRFSPAWLSLSGPGIKHGAARRKLRDTILSATLLSIVLAVCKSIF